MSHVFYFENNLCFQSTGDGGSEATLWCRYYRDEYVKIQRTYPLDFDPSAEWHSYTLDVRVSPTGPEQVITIIISSSQWFKTFLCPDDFHIFISVCINVSLRIIMVRIRRNVSSMGRKNLICAFGPEQEFSIKQKRRHE